MAPNFKLEDTQNFLNLGAKIDRKWQNVFSQIFGLGLDRKWVSADVQNVFWLGFGQEMADFSLGEL